MVEKLVCVWIGAEADDAIQLAQNLRYGIASLYIPHSLLTAPHVILVWGLSNQLIFETFRESLLKLADERCIELGARTEHGVCRRRLGFNIKGWC